MLESSMLFIVNDHGAVKSCLWETAILFLEMHIYDIAVR